MNLQGIIKNRLNDIVNKKDITGLMELEYLFNKQYGLRSVEYPSNSMGIFTKKLRICKKYSTFTKV
jgi:hypothetical protein